MSSIIPTEPLRALARLGSFLQGQAASRVEGAANANRRGGRVSGAAASLTRIPPTTSSIGGNNIDNLRWLDLQRAVASLVMISVLDSRRPSQLA